MMRVIITPGPLKGELDAIPSKSDAHRAVLAAALSDKPTDLILPALSQDIEATVACVAALGAAVVRTQTGLRITPQAQDAPVAASLFFGESGTTARLVLPVAAALCERVEAGGAGVCPPGPWRPCAAPFRKTAAASAATGCPYRCAARFRPACTNCRAISAPSTYPACSSRCLCWRATAWSRSLRLCSRPDMWT